MSADLVVPKLYMGNAPPRGVDWTYAPAKHLVLAAQELRRSQSPQQFPGAEVFYAPLRDDYSRALKPEELATIIGAAERVAQWRKEGKPVVVTCHEGKNRSGVITAASLVLSNEASPEGAIRLVRAARGPLALQNPQFLKVLHTLGKADQVRTAS